MLHELRAPGSDSALHAEMENDHASGAPENGHAYGRVGYTHGGGIDQPLDVARTGYAGLVVIAPHTDWRGGFVGGSWMNGEATQQSAGAVNCTANSAVKPCVSLTWPGGQVTVDGAVANPASGIRPWWGNLATDKADGSGLKYMRNRYPWHMSSGTPFHVWRGERSVR